MIVKLKWMGGGKYAGLVMIPTRDLTDFDIETISKRDGKAEQELIDELCSHGLYEVLEEFICDTCDKPLKTNSALIKHELKHVKPLANEEKTGEET